MQEQVFQAAPAIQFQADIPGWNQPTTHLFFSLVPPPRGCYTLWSTRGLDPLLISQYISTILSYVIFYFSQYFPSRLRLNIVAKICCSLAVNNEFSAELISHLLVLLLFCITMVKWPDSDESLVQLKS